MCESVTLHLSQRRAWLIAVSWPQSEHVGRGDPQARMGGEGGEGTPDLNLEDMDGEFPRSFPRLPCYLHRSLGLPPFPFTLLSSQ